MIKTCLKWLLSFFIINSTAWAAETQTIQVVAAENFYGETAKQLGSPYVQAVSIMNNPNQDPHMFNAGSKIAVLINDADIVIENGVDYDPWIEKLYASGNKKAVLINVGKLTHRKNGDNPHIWYDPETMPIFAKALVNEFIKRDPMHKSVYEQNLVDFLAHALMYQTVVEHVREKCSGTSVTATEPILGYLIRALQFKMLNEDFQQDMMNGADLTPNEIIQFEQSLNDKEVKLLIYNAQVTDPTTENLKKLALKKGIPVLGVSETMPSKEYYYDWMTEIVRKLERKLE